MAVGVPQGEAQRGVAAGPLYAWGIARSGSPKDATLARPRRFVAGLVLLWLNPKGWAMTLSAAAAFSPSTAGLSVLVIAGAILPFL